MNPAEGYSSAAAAAGSPRISRTAAVYGSDFPVLLAPMAGVTDLPFRRLCREQGCTMAYTEMVSAKALYYHNKNTHTLLARGPEETRLAVQLFGSEPELMAEMGAVLAESFEVIDVNMGCPVPKVVNNGEGSALMLQPEKAAAIVAAMVRKIRRPVTVKIRKGFDAAHINAAELARRLEAAGAAAITVHGRTREQYYSGQADWEIIRQVREAVSIPVIGNGDIWNAADALRMREETGCSGVMIARGARGNPWIFRDICALLAGSGLPSPPSLTERWQMMDRHLHLLTAEKGEDTGVREMRKHIGWYSAGMPGAAALRFRANTITTLAGWEELRDDCILRGRTQPQAAVRP